MTKSTRKQPPAATALSDEALKAANGGYKVTFSDVIISSYQTGGSSGDVVPLDGRDNHLGNATSKK